MARTLITLTRTPDFCSQTDREQMHSERITCPQGIEIAYHELRDRNSGQTLVWLDGNNYWHSSGTGEIYSSIDITPC